MGNKFSSFKDFVPDESDICLLSDIRVGNSKRNKNDGNRNDGGLILYINESIPGKSINTYDFKGVSGIIVFEFSGSNKKCTANIYLFKISNRKTRRRCEIYSKLTRKTPP